MSPAASAAGASPATHAGLDGELAPWQRRAWEHACAAMDAGRLAHGLLICGPADLGKRALAERLARRMLCLQRAGDADACGQCRSCLLFAQRVQYDPAETRPDGSLSHPFGRSAHPDLHLVGFEINDKTGKPRSEIVIEQIRRLSEKLALTPQYGGERGGQVAILEPADAINHHACNALLKTLEEPHPGRYLWLVTADPAWLSATVRSRCQRIELRLPGDAEALAWLRGQGHAEATAREALDAARGHPGLAARWLAEGGLALRREVAADLAALRKGERTPSEIAQRWAAEDPEPRLRHAADLALAEATRLGGGAPGTLPPADARLTDVRRIRTLAAWFDAANRTRGLLRTTVRVDLALVALLLQWRESGTAGRPPPASAAPGRPSSQSGARR